MEIFKYITLFDSSLFHPCGSKLLIPKQKQYFGGELLLLCLQECLDPCSKHKNTNMNQNINQNQNQSKNGVQATNISQDEQVSERRLSQCWT